MKNLFPQNLKNIYHLGQAILANFIYGFPSWNIKVIGVTGTNGKTTTCQMVSRILEEDGHKIAFSTTINFKVGDKEWVNKTKFTTLSPFAVQEFILQAVKAKCEYLILETSSHSLDQRRIWGINYDMAVITNVTREHLDYHKTMEEYRKAKLKIFRNAKAAIVNLDMEKPEEFIAYKNLKKFLYSIKYNVSSIMYKKISDQYGDIEIINAENIKLNAYNTSFMIHNTLFTLNIPGKFNIENSLAAVCVGLNNGISLEKCARALEKIKGVPGRMEYVKNDKGLNIIIDYAVTPDSLEKLYELIKNIKSSLPLEKFTRNAFDAGGGVLRQMSERGISKKNPPSSPFKKGGESKVISVFGACGERDRGKRPIMGEIVAKCADYIILTNEDPYNEDPQQIIDEVFEGVPLCHSERSEAKSKNLIKSLGKARDDNFCFTENVNCWRILDRREAIRKALQMAKPGDYILVTGKGAEETMAVGNQRIPWNDKKVILEELKKLGS